MSEPLHVADWRTESFREWRARFRVYRVYIEYRFDKTVRFRELAQAELCCQHGSPLREGE